MSYISRHTQATIDLSALVKNYEYIDSLAPQSNTIAVIKADGYGHDANKVAHALSSKVSLFAVGFIDEALALRIDGVDTPILILEGAFNESDIDIAIKNNFILMFHSEYQIDWLLNNLANVNAQSYRSNLWIKVNTGMNRLGFSVEDVPKVIAKLPVEVQKTIVLCSHFSTAEQTQSAKPIAQLNKLKQLVSQYDCQFSMANSAGILNWPESHGSYTRLGLSLYGVSPIINCEISQPLIPVMTLEANIIAIHSLEIGETVGYGDIWQAKRKSTIATVAIGYADGYPRNAKSGTPVAINGEIALTVGRVSMDMITVDITDLLESKSITEGDLVELWGKHISIDTVAEYSDTINYELLTRVSKRVPKVVAN